LDELAREGIGVRGHVDTTGEGIALVVEHHLLHLESGREELAREDTDSVSRGCSCDTEHILGGLQFYSDLALLGQS
jgi:hypothetical protein